MPWRSIKGLQEYLGDTLGMLGEFFGLPVDTLWEIVTSALVPAGTLDTLSALNVPGCPKASGGLTRSLWAEMVFPDARSRVV